MKCDILDWGGLWCVSEWLEDEKVWRVVCWCESEKDAKETVKKLKAEKGGLTR